MANDLYDGPCEAGCQHFHGGEVKHHPDCGHYPESLTKMNADTIEALQAENVRLRGDRDFWKETAIVETQSRVNEAARCGFFRDILVGASASLAAAISLLERGGKSAKKAAPSDKMFDQMIDDYRSSLERARAALQQDKEG